MAFQYFEHFTRYQKICNEIVAIINAAANQQLLNSAILCGLKNMLYFI